MGNSQDRQRWLIRFLVAVTMLAMQGSPWSRAETPMVVDAASGLRLLVVHLGGSRARQSPLCAVHNRHNHFQIA